MMTKNQSPFTVIVDTREQLEYTFTDVPADHDEGGPDSTLVVPTMKLALPVGDYSILGLPQIVIERKSKEDLYSSISTTKARDNFKGRLQRMAAEYMFAMVLVESEWSDLLEHPPTFTQFSPKALFRTILSWQQRYPQVHWLLMPGRDLAEIACYRVLDRFWSDNRGIAARLDEIDKELGRVRVGGQDRIRAAAGADAAEGEMVARQLDALRAAEGMSPGEVTAAWAAGKARAAGAGGTR